MKHISILLALTAALAHAPPSYTVNILLVSPPGETWTTDEQQAAVDAVRAAVLWWPAHSPVAVPTFDLGGVTVVAPSDFSYDEFTWERAYIPMAADFETSGNTDLTVFLIDNSASHNTMGGAVGWAQTPMRTITAVSSIADLPAVLTHEEGHAVLGLGHAPLGALDIMAPVVPTEAYQAGVLGYYTLTALGAPLHRTYLPTTSAAGSAPTRAP